MKSLGIDSGITGIDFPLNSKPSLYRRAVERIREDPNAIGGLITSHKLNLLAASRELFDELDESASLMNEVSCMTKIGGKFIGKALDDKTSVLALQKLLPTDYWESSSSDLLILGAGGASLALTLGLQNSIKASKAVPHKIHVTARSPLRIQEMKKLHQKISFQIPIEYHVTPSPTEADSLVSSLSPGSVVVNATGMGKDVPGSPITSKAVFPVDGWAWDMNYRGERLFLEQAKSQSETKNINVIDGWDYFIYSWTQVISEVHHLNIPPSGPLFEELSNIARLES